MDWIDISLEKGDINHLEKLSWGGMMEFKMNNSFYAIKEVSQEILQQEKTDEEDGYYYGQTRFKEQVILIDKDLSTERKRKTLIHELTHVYIREYLTTRDISPNEEVLCDIHANSHDIIHRILEDYFKNEKVE